MLVPTRQSGMLGLAAIYLTFPLTSCGVLKARDHTVARLYQFPPGTWVENMAVRTNGDILSVDSMSNVLTEINPSQQSADESYVFPTSNLRTISIASIIPDFLVVNVLPCDITAEQCTGNQTQTFTVDYRPVGTNGITAPSVAQLPCDWAEVGSLNGAVALSQNLVLFADSLKGGIWGLDLTTNATKYLFTDPLMTPSPLTKPTGINGIRLLGSQLYFTNSAQAVLGRVEIDLTTGNKVGSATVVATSTEWLKRPEDFDIDNDYAYVADLGSDMVSRVELATGKLENWAALSGPTSVRWAQTGKGISDGGRMMYVSTSGFKSGDLAGEDVGGAVYAVLT